MAKVSVEECRRLDAFQFGSGSCRLALEGKGLPVSGSLIWRDRFTRQQLASISYSARTGEVELSYNQRLLSPNEVRYAVPVELASGGRAFFQCPGRGCGRRVRYLYLYGRYFLCRHCHDLCYFSQLHRPIRLDPGAGGADEKGNRDEEAEERTPREIDEARVEELVRKQEREQAERERQWRRRHVQRTGRPGRPKEKRRYRHDDSRRVELGPREAYCCRCRAPRPYRYPRRAELAPLADPATGEIFGTRVAIRAHCRVCNTPVFRIVRPEEAEGLQEFYGG